MPRILSSNSLSYSTKQRRRGSMPSVSGSVSRRDNLRRSSTQQQSVLQDWFGILTGNPSASVNSQEENTSRASVPSRSALSSLSSSGRNTPPSLAQPSASPSRRHIMPRRSSSASIQSYDYPRHEQCESSWGQWVDVAEADKEIVRHSRVLSRKELAHTVPLGPPQYWSRHA